MIHSDIDKLEKFLKSRFGFQIPERIEFEGMSRDRLASWLAKDDTVRSRVVNLSMNDFLTEDFLFNNQIERAVSETVVQKELKIYIGIVSFDGRGKAALRTGGNTFNNLKNLEKQGLITRFLSYQGDRNNRSPLCRFAIEEGIRVFFVDDVSVVDQTHKKLLGKKVRGKTENILKFLLMLDKEVQKKNLDPKKVFVLFLDDDYTLLDERAHYILIASWVLSFAESDFKGIGRLINRCKGVAFVKNGGVRINFPTILTDKIIRGDQEVIKNYRSLIIEAIRLSIGLNDSHKVDSLNQLKCMIRKLKKLPADLILTPENLACVISSNELDLIREIMNTYFYAGGRVTKPFTRKNVHESENFLSYWLGSFTYILHGDQGTTLDNWRRLKLGQGYAFESSVIIQFLMDKNFADKRVADIRNTPHAHQPQEQHRVEGMEDLINLVTETLRVYYGNWDVGSFIARYQKRTRVSWRADGSYLRLKVKPEKGILFYPPSTQLRLYTSELKSKLSKQKYISQTEYVSESKEKNIPGKGGITEVSTIR